MTFFAHMILVDDRTNTAMTLARTYVTQKGAPEPVSKYALKMIVK